MHEASLVKSLLGQVMNLVHEHQAQNALRVHVQYGPLSGIEPELFQAAFERMRAEVGCCDCVLELEWVPLLAVCGACEQSFESAELRFDCPRCGSFQIQFISGEAIMLEQVELQRSDVGIVSS